MASLPLSLNKMADKTDNEGEISSILIELENAEQDDSSIEEQVEEQIGSDDDEALPAMDDHTIECDLEDHVIVAIQEFVQSKNNTVDTSQDDGPSGARKKPNKRNSGTSSFEFNVQESNSETSILKVKEYAFFGKNNYHEWQSEPSASSRDKIPSKNIVRRRTGPKCEAGSVLSPVDCFKLFFSEDILRKILNHTNEEIRQHREYYKVTDNPTLRDMTIEEIRALLGVLLLSAAMKQNHLNTDLLFKQEYCGGHYLACFSQNRFKFLLICLRFDDKKTREERSKITWLAPISEIWDKFITSCRTCYEPGLCLTIGEQLVGFRGKCPFMMYIPCKPDKYGMKLMMMCDAATYYMVDAIAYTGSSPEGIPTAEFYVDKLVETVKGSNRNVTMDSRFVSIPLARNLLRNKLTMIGTIKQNKKELPPEFTDVKYQNREIGSSFFLLDEDIAAVPFKAKMNTDVTLISSFHADTSARGSCGKTEMILKYNQTKGAVHSFDQLCRNMDCKRKTNRWPLTFFYNMLNISSINSFVIFTHNNLAEGKKPLSRMDFMLLLHQQLTLDFLKIRISKFGMPTHTKELIARTSKGVTLTTQQQQEAAISRKRTICSFCHYSKRRMTTSYCCVKICLRPICLEHGDKICWQCVNELNARPNECHTSNNILL